MSITKGDRISAIEIALIAMKDVLDYTDLEDKLVLHPRVEEFNNKHIIEAEKWLLDIRNTIFKNVERIWNMQRPELWFRYKKWGMCDDNRETVLLNEQLDILKKKIRSSERPALFKKGKVNAWIKRLDKKATSKTSKSAGNKTKRATCSAAHTD